ncbi:MAG: hypothetical protein BGO55_03345 [Sphingobacteriales bacterium 50-39]|nr:hypothetical protein [Sphingobacteriales bacterium]OJW55589.1 MAG: hypothetical protein BGO55_03345 [Sphingobacteriales bacterium 50-39]
MKTKIYVQELIIPSDAMPEVATILVNNELTNEIIGSDEENETITLEVQYEKEERDAFQEILDVVESYEDAEEEEGDDEEEEEE